MAGIVNTLDTGLTDETRTQILEEVLPTAAQRGGVLQQLRDRADLIHQRRGPRVAAGDRANRPLRFKHGDLRCCRRCYAIGLRRTCGSCGEVGDIASRTPGGDPVCDRCTKVDPANHETCGECGRRARCRPRQDATRLCRSCHTEPVALCSRCGKSKPYYRSATPSPICPSCSRSKAPCVRCGNVRLIAYRADDGGALCQACGETPEPCSSCGRDSRVITRTPDGPICRNCYRADPRFVRECRTCGTVEHLYHDGLCNYGPRLTTAPSRGQQAPRPAHLDRHRRGPSRKEHPPWLRRERRPAAPLTSSIVRDNQSTGTGADARQT